MKWRKCSPAVHRTCRGPRDELPDGRVIYRCVLTYKVSVTEGGKFEAAIPLTNGYDILLFYLLLNLFRSNGDDQIAPDAETSP
jgi:hypothetical protein